MLPALLPTDETDRLLALESSHLLERRSDQRIKLIVELAAELLGKPAAGFALVASDTVVSHIRVGSIKPNVPRDLAFCAHAVLSRGVPFIVENALLDPRFNENPFVIDNPGVRFYAGAPVRSASGRTVGVLCVLDHQPATMSQMQIQTLQRLASKLEAFVQEDRRTNRPRKTSLEGLRQAVATNALTLCWQPIVTAASLDVTGHEALVRWAAPGGEIAPDLFIAAAETSGLIERIDRFVIRTACAVAAGDPDLRNISVNVSPRWFRYHKLALLNAVTDALSSAALAPERLTIELTERVLVADAERALTEILALKELGVRVALDDFGIGYSGLGYLEQFPFDIVKLDKAFVQGLGINYRADAVARAVIELGHDLGMTVCAEGIEDERQLSILRSLGCDLVQGYLIGAPAARGASAALENADRKRVRNAA